MQLFPHLRDIVKGKLQVQLPYAASCTSWQVLEEALVRCHITLQDEPIVGKEDLADVVVHASIDVEQRAREGEPGCTVPPS